MIRQWHLGYDLDGLAELIDSAFTDELKEEGIHIKKELEYIKRLYPFIWIVDNLLAPLSERYRHMFHGYVWEDKGKIVGSVGVSKSGKDTKRWYISTVGVAPEYRRRGIARALVSEAIGFALSRGADIITLDVRSDNPPALILYESLEFVPIDVFHEFKCENIEEAEDEDFFQKIDSKDWGDEFELAKRTTPESVQRMRPLREKDFRPTLLEIMAKRILERPVQLLLRQEIFRYKVAREERMIATFTLTAKRRTSPHSLLLRIEREYQIEVVEKAVYKTFRILKDFPKNNILAYVNDNDKDTMAVLEKHNFKKVMTDRKMALDLREMLLLVDEDDNVLGKETKEKCHDGEGLLHRAFMVMVLEDGKLLLTCRSRHKRLWPGRWDCSVSSHVHEGESYEDSAKKRLEEELGIECGNVEYLFKFRYKIPYEKLGAENEICAVLVAHYNGEMNPARDEISSHKFMEYGKFVEDMARNPEKYCPWVGIAFDNMKKEHRNHFENM